MKYEIFINYRRRDSVGVAKSLHDKLSAKFGSKSVFLDTEDIQGGDKWENVLEKSGKYARVAVVIIGEDWLEKNDEGNHRIKDDGDWVRNEIKLALEHNLTLFPILVNAAIMPDKKDLPEDIHAIMNFQALNLRSTRFKDDFNNISNSICAKLHTKTKCFFLQYKRSILGGLLFMAVAFSAFLITQKDAPCPDFNQESNLNVLFLPSRKMASEEDNVVKEFYDKSKPNFNADIQKYGNRISELTEFEPVTKSCDADVFLAIQNSQSGKEFRFGFSNDSLERLSYTTELERVSTFTKLSELINESEFHENMDGLICFLATYIYRTKGSEFVKESFQNNCELGSSNVALKKLHYDMQSDIYIIKEDYENALKTIEAREKLDPIDDLTKAKKADVAERLKRYDVAVDTYTELIGTSIYSNEKLLEKRGDQYIELKDYKNAEKDYKEATIRNPDNKVIERKYEGVKTKISTININLAGSLQAPNLREDQKIKNAERAIQIGRFDDAQKILNTLKPESKSLMEVQGLNLEVQLEKGQIVDRSPIPQKVLSNQRLKTKLIRDGKSNEQINENRK